jgi:hypothetical protein
MLQFPAVLIFILFFKESGAAPVVKQPENAWSNEVVPAAIDPEIARLIEIMNLPEPWDHNWYTH